MTVAADLRSDRGRQLMDRISDLNATIELDREKVSGVLYREIGEEEDSDKRRNVIALRRHLYNFRRPEAGSHLATLMNDLSERWPDVRRFTLNLDEREQITREFADVFEADRNLIRSRLSAWVQTPAFQRGLLLASESLFDAQVAYHRAPPTGALPRRMARTERGLLRYLLRASMKATPFSTFCIIAPGYIHPETEGLQSGFVGDVNPIKMSVRLNKGLYDLLTRKLAARPAVRDALTIEVNPTLRHVGENCVFLALSEGRETFQRVPASPVFLLLLSMVTESPGIRFREFIEMIAAHPEIDCKPEEAERYAAQMLAAGAIRLCFGISEQEANWEIPLAHLLAGIPDPIAQETARYLSDLEKCVQASETAALGEHVRIAAEMKRLVAVVFDAFDVTGVPPLPFLEDATANLRQVIQRTDALSALERTMGRLVAAGLRLSWPRARQAELRHFFDTHFVRNNEVQLLDFYEAFYREHFKQYLSLADRVAQEGVKVAEGYDFENPFRLPLIDEIGSAQNELMNLVRRRLAESPEAEELELSLDEIEAIVSEVAWSPSRPTSHTLLGTLASRLGAADNLRFVCRRWQSAVGHGRMFSRWLHMLEPDFLRRLRHENSGFVESVRYAEIAADGRHNANLHPAIVPWDISYPNTEGTRGPNAIHPTELVVEPDPSDPNALRLRHVSSNATVVPLDLGFVAPQSRPPLYQLLTAFAPPPGLTFPLPNLPTEPSKDPKDGNHKAVSCLPRIVIGDIVVSRRRWVLSHSSIPKAVAGETDWQYALRLDRWRHDCGLPVAGYLRYIYASIAEPKSEELGAAGGDEPKPQANKGMRTRLNELKPQYIDFSSPLCANLLQHEATSDRPSRLIFEEQYPTQTEVPTVEGRPHAIEHVLQVTCRP